MPETIVQLDYYDQQKHTIHLQESKKKKKNLDFTVL